MVNHGAERYILEGVTDASAICQGVSYSIIRRIHSEGAVIVTTPSFCYM